MAYDTPDYGDDNYKLLWAIATNTAEGKVTAELPSYGDSLNELLRKIAVNTSIASSGGGGSTAEPTKVAVYAHEVAANTGGGTTTTGSFLTAPVTAELSDPDNICTIAANRMRPIAGTYRVWGVSHVYGAGEHKARLQNITDGTTTAPGLSSYNPQETGSHFYANNVVTDGTKDYEVQHRVAAGQATIGFGTPCNFGVNEIYRLVVWEKIA